MTYEYENNNSLKKLISRINIKTPKKMDSFKLRKLYTNANNIRFVPFDSRTSKILSILQYSIV